MHPNCRQSTQTGFVENESCGEDLNFKITGLRRSLLRPFFRTCPELFLNLTTSDKGRRLSLMSRPSRAATCVEPNVDARRIPGIRLVDDVKLPITVQVSQL